MTTEDMLIQMVCIVDDEMKDMPTHTQALLSPSDVVTIGLQFALKGGHVRAFSRGFSRDDAPVFAGWPERTRVQRLLKTHQDGCARVLAAPSFFPVIDRYPIEWLFPIRQGRSPQQVGKQGKDKGRWSVGLTWCWLRNDSGHVGVWDWATMHVHDQHVHPVIERVNGQSIVLAASGFRRVKGVPDHGTRCAKGTGNDRMTVETAVSMVTVVCDLKRLHHRLPPSIQAHLASVVAMFNVVLTLFHLFHPDADPFQMSIAEFSLETSTNG